MVSPEFPYSSLLPLTNNLFAGFLSGFYPSVPPLCRGINDVRKPGQPQFHTGCATSRWKQLSFYHKSISHKPFYFHQVWNFPYFQIYWRVVYCLQTIQYWALLKKAFPWILQTSNLRSWDSSALPSSSVQKAFKAGRLSFGQIRMYTIHFYLDLYALPQLQCAKTKSDKPIPPSCGFFGSFLFISSLHCLGWMKWETETENENYSTARTNEMLRQLTEQWIRAPSIVWIWWDTELSRGKIQAFFNSYIYQNLPLCT